MEEAPGNYHRLILVIGGPGTGKTAMLRQLGSDRGMSVLNVNLEVSQALLNLTERQRTLQVADALSDLVNGQVGDIVILDNLEILFDPILKQDPVRLLQSISRRRTLIAAVGFVGADGYVVYAQAGHPEHRRYLARDFVVIDAG